MHGGDITFCHIKNLNAFKKCEETVMYTINKTEAPQPLNFRNRGSYWRDLFESMCRNDWVRIPKDHYARASAAASTYLKGRYSLYRIDDGSSDYCLLKLR